MSPDDAGRLAATNGLPKPVEKPPRLARDKYGAELTVRDGRHVVAIQAIATLEQHEAIELSDWLRWAASYQEHVNG